VKSIPTPVRSALPADHDTSLRRNAENVIPAESGRLLLNTASHEG